MLRIIKNYTANSNSVPYYIEYLSEGEYLFECWGAQGGHSNGGKGGYISGKIKLLEKTTLYIVVGSQGSQTAGGFNGGGNGGYSHLNFYDGYGGGGETDIRLDPNNIETRIIVAGGGGGACGHSNINLGGHAGGIEGRASRRVDGVDPYCTGSLSQGGNQAYGVKFQGDNGQSKYIHGYCGEEGNGGGGGGYYGGQTVKAQEDGSDSGGGGGSSCISGHPQCFTYPEYIFTDIKIIAGDEQFISPTGTTETGHSGNGYARISKYVTLPTKNPKIAKAKRKFLCI